MLAIVVKAREALEYEMDEVRNPDKKIDFVGSDYLRKIKEITVSFNNLTDSSIRLAKAEKELENDMTPDEEREAVAEYIKTMEYEERMKFLNRLNAWHKANSI
jgi:hypothetical protein